MAAIALRHGAGRRVTALTVRGAAVTCALTAVAGTLTSGASASESRAEPIPGTSCRADQAGVTVQTKAGVVRCIPAGILDSHLGPVAGPDLKVPGRWELIAVAPRAQGAAAQWTDGDVATIDPLRSCRPRDPAGPRNIGLGWPRAADRLASTGTVRIAVIPVQSTGSASPNADNWLDQTSEWRNGRTLLEYADDLQQAQSNRRSRFAFTVTPTVTVPRPLADYGITRSNREVGTAFDALMADVLRAADPVVDFRRFDAFLVLPPQGSIAFGPAWARTAGAGVTVDGVEMRNGTVVGDENRATSPAEIIVHEFGHLMALPDLYAADPTGYRYVGAMSQMSNPYQFRGVTGYEEWLLRWIPESRVICVKPSPARAKDVTLASVSGPVTTAKGHLLAMVPLGAGRALGVEYRTRQGLDAALGRPGIHVYLIDASRPTMRGPMTSYRADALTLEPLADTSNADAISAATFATQDAIDAALLQPGQSITYQGIRVSVPDLPQQRPAAGLDANRPPTTLTVRIQRAR